MLRELTWIFLLLSVLLPVIVLRATSDPGGQMSQTSVMSLLLLMDNLPQFLRFERHIDVGHAEGVGDGGDDSRGRANRAGLTDTFDTEGIVRCGGDGVIQLE